MESGVEIRMRLEARRAEIEEAVVTRVNAIAGPLDGTDPTYLSGLRVTVATALDYGLSVIDGGEEHSMTPPPFLLAQARLAAANGVGLDTVLRRYFAGYSLLSNFLIEEASRDQAGDAPTFKRVIRKQAVLFDRLIAAVSEEYGREARERPTSTEQRRAERVRRLLDGELTDAIDLAYDMARHHTALVAAGPQAGDAVRDLADGLDRRLLLIRPRAEFVWAWLGGRRRLDAEELVCRASATWPADIDLAIGEPGEGLAGWRLSHRQALAALPVGRRREKPVRYADVALLASALNNEVLTSSLWNLFLEPLTSSPTGSKALCETLRAYFKADRNVSSAAIVLGVSRQTVTTRLRTVEERLRRPLDTCASQVELALQLAEQDEVRELVTPSTS